MLNTIFKSRGERFLLVLGFLHSLLSLDLNGYLLWIWISRDFHFLKFGPFDRFYYSRATPNPLNPDLHNITAPKPRYKTVQNFEECVLTSDPECSFETGRLYDLAIPYFCGHDRSCM